ncbi:hypothetical protein [Clostridium sp.]|uniref:hypothetical protein n=1 Tax=Clostridium sp. TaxID=1506 RepID=UPI00283DEBD4|nr:hypothetical protein [Clostridium sp.]MDR3597045.1 hypothetical protein [Clostridium sp.]
MDINVNVRLESPELMAAILALAEALPKIKLGEVTSEMDKNSMESEEPAVVNTTINKESSKKETKKEDVKTIELEEVREKLASLLKEGKQKEVKALITKYGAKKLTDIDSACYEKLLKEAEGL